MFEAIITAIKGVIGLLRKGEESRKAKLEIEKLQREKEKEVSLIKPATLEEIKEYDEKYRRIKAIEEARAAKGAAGGKVGIAVGQGITIIEVIVIVIIIIILSGLLGGR